MAETGLILKGVGGFYTVLNDRGEEVVCRARGRFRKDGISPVVGDRVEYLNDGEGRYVSEILPRKNLFVRPAVANLDVTNALVKATEILKLFNFEVSFLPYCKNLP